MCLLVPETLASIFNTNVEKFFESFVSHRKTHIHEAQHPNPLTSPNKGWQTGSALLGAGLPNAANQQ
jgi:hypothetical protein